MGTRRNVLLVYSLHTNDMAGSRFFAAIRDGLTLSDLPVAEPFLR